MTSLLTGRLWKVATAGALIIIFALGTLLTSTYLQNRDIMKQRDVLAKKIDDPTSGYIAQLAQARTNVLTLTAEVDRQNAAYDKLSVESQTRLRDAEARLAVAQAETRALERKVAGFLATKPQGATLEDRVRDIDDRAMKEFLP